MEKREMRINILIPLILTLLGIISRGEWALKGEENQDKKWVNFSNPPHRFVFECQEAKLEHDCKEPDRFQCDRCDKSYLVKARVYIFQPPVRGIYFAKYYGGGGRGMAAGEKMITEGVGKK